MFILRVFSFQILMKSHEINKVAQNPEMVSTKRSLKRIPNSLIFRLFSEK